MGIAIETERPITMDMFIVSGELIRENEEYYVTSIPGGTQIWNKKWYRHSSLIVNDDNDRTT